MFELADRLVGIYKTHNVTKSVTINPKECLQMASRQQRQQERQGKELAAARPRAAAQVEEAYCFAVVTPTVFSGEPAVISHLFQSPFFFFFRLCQCLCPVLGVLVVFVREIVITPRLLLVNYLS